MEISFSAQLVAIACGEVNSLESHMLDLKGLSITRKTHVKCWRKQQDLLGEPLRNMACCR